MVGRYSSIVIVEGFDGKCSVKALFCQEFKVADFVTTSYTIPLDI